jgi:hypothetical protein
LAETGAGGAALGFDWREWKRLVQTGQPARSLRRFLRGQGMGGGTFRV